MTFFSEILWVWKWKLVIYLLPHIFSKFNECTSVCPSATPRGETWFFSAAIYDTTLIFSLYLWQSIIYICPSIHLLFNFQLLYKDGFLFFSLSRNSYITIWPIRYVSQTSKDIKFFIWKGFLIFFQLLYLFYHFNLISRLYIHDFSLSNFRKLRYYWA